MEKVASYLKREDVGKLSDKFLFGKKPGVNYTRLKYIDVDEASGSGETEIGLEFIVEFPIEFYSLIEYWIKTKNSEIHDLFYNLIEESREMRNYIDDRIVVNELKKQLKIHNYKLRRSGKFGLVSGSFWIT